MKRRPQRKRKALDIILPPCASSLAAAALIRTILHEGAVYSGDISRPRREPPRAASTGRPCARETPTSPIVSVEGTPIDYPVVSPREGDPQGFYLNHDFDRNWSFTGCPLPRPAARQTGATRSSTTTNFDSEMFTYLRDAWRQEKFDTLGDMYWSTPLGALCAHPAFSLSVDKSFAGIQRFDLSPATRAWSQTSAQTGARAEGCDDLRAHATRAVTLVTCTGNFAGGRARTLTVFVAEFFRKTCHTMEKRHKRGIKTV